MTPISTRIRLHGRLGALLGVLSCASLHADDTTQRDACDAPDFATVLHAASPDVPTHARAIWLDERRLHWPDAPVDAARFVLHAAPRGGIAARVGAPVSGAQSRVVLRRDADPLPAALSSRWRYVGKGPPLTLGASDAKGLAEMLRGEVIVTADDARGHVIASTGTQTPGALDAIYGAAAEDATLGVRFGAAQNASTTAGRATTFSLWAPTARDVAVCVYPDGVAASTAMLPMKRDASTGVWSAADHSGASSRGRYYTYLVDVFAPGTGVVRNRVTDPYAVSLTADSRRAYIGDLDDAALKPEGWDAATSPAALRANTDLTLYELHVRDFSVSDATVPPPLRGKYLAFTQRESAGMRHLRVLQQAGITDIHLLPVFDLATVPESACVTPEISGDPASETQQRIVGEQSANDCFNWGYDPYHFNAPEGSYATDAADGAVRVREFRAMVQALHAAGLRVGMDVVYNHTSASGQVERAVLDRTVPGYYQRLDANGVVATSTCCANTATEHRMMAKLMIDSVALWAREYRIDSFRFDLMGHQPRAAMEALQRRVDGAAGRRVPLIGEGWNFGEIADGVRFVQAAQGDLNGTGIATFSDRARDAVRGGGPADDDARLVLRNGWISGADGAVSDTERARLADLVRVGLVGTLADYEMTNAAGERVPLSRLDYNGHPAAYASEPGEVVNYVENHDGLTLYDINALKLPPDTDPMERARVQVLALAVVAFSQGVAYFHAGGELLRSKSLDRNSYDSGDWFNRIDWRGEEHTFGSGLPPKADNGKAWDVMRPLLADPDLVATPEAIAWTRGAFADLLRIRKSSSLFRLRSAAEVRARLTFFNTGRDQIPGVIAAHLDGIGLPGEPFSEVVYVLNADTVPRSAALPAARGKRYVLHPIQGAANAGDQRLRNAASFDRKAASFTVPPRSAVVFVVRATR